MADKLMYITNDGTQYNSFCILQLVVETFGPSTKNKNFIKVFLPTNKKTLLKIFGDECNKQPNVLSLHDIK